MLKLEILNHWIVPQQGKFHSEIDEEPFFWHRGAKQFIPSPPMNA